MLITQLSRQSQQSISNHGALWLPACSGGLVSVPLTWERSIWRDAALPPYSRILGDMPRRVGVLLAAPMLAGGLLCLAALIILGLPLSARALPAVAGIGDQPNFGFWILDFGLRQHQIQNPKSKIQNPKDPQ